MNKIKYIFLATAMIALAASCTDDNDWGTTSQKRLFAPVNVGAHVSSLQDSLVVTWNPTTGAEKYLVEVSDTTFWAADSTYIEDTLATSRKFIVESNGWYELDPAPSTYYVRVKAFSTALGWTGWSYFHDEEKTRTWKPGSVTVKGPEPESSHLIDITASGDGSTVQMGDYSATASGMGSENSDYPGYFMLNSKTLSTIEVRGDFLKGDTVAVDVLITKTSKQVYLETDKGTITLPCEQGSPQHLTTILPFACNTIGLYASQPATSTVVDGKYHYYVHVKNIYVARDE